MPGRRLPLLWICLVSCATATTLADPSTEPNLPLDARLTQAAKASSLPLRFDGETFSGPAWSRLIERGQQAQFFLIGEQHGIAENARLAAALFEALVDSGYSKVAIETSPQMAAEMDRVLRRDGLAGLRGLFSRPGGEPAFFGMKEEAEFLAAARSAVDGREPVLWGLDYEVAADRQLIRHLKRFRKPSRAKRALNALEAASETSWDRYGETRDPSDIFSFAGEPQLVRDIRKAWRRPPREAAWALDTLEQTLEINELWSAGRVWESNERRARWLRANFLRYWRGSRAGPDTRVLAKFGASHMVRGRNSNETFDLGTLLPEIAETHSQVTFSLLVLAGPGSQTSNFDPSSWSYRPGPARGGYAKGLEPIIAAADARHFTLIDLHPLRRLVSGSASPDASAQLLRTVHGFDAVLIMSGSTPSAPF